MRLYIILKGGEIIESPTPGEYAGYKKGKIFGRLDCKTGMRMKRENRVFFHTLEDAVREGCRPIDEEDFEKIRHLIPEKTLEEFYHRR